MGFDGWCAIHLISVVESSDNDCTNGQVSMLAVCMICFSVLTIRITTFAACISRYAYLDVDSRWIFDSDNIMARCEIWII